MLHVRDAGDLEKQMLLCRRLYSHFHGIEPLLRDIWQAVVPSSVVDSNRDSPSVERAAAILFAVSDVLARYDPQSAPESRRLAGSLVETLDSVSRHGGLWPASLMDAYTEMSRDMLALDLLSLLTTLLGSALFGGHAACPPGAQAADMDAGSHCPSCGQSAHYASHAFGSGSKVLECPLCFKQWSHTRLKCPYCGNTDSESMGYFSLEGIDRCRVHYCSLCNCYHKVFELRDVEGERPILYLHHLGSLLCDTVACREGFVPGSSLWWNDEVTASTDGGKPDESHSTRLP